MIRSAHILYALLWRVRQFYLLNNIQTQDQLVILSNYISHYFIDKAIEAL